MKQVVQQVLIWDDLYKKINDKDVEADRTDVYLAFNGRAVTLDLTIDHFRALEAVLADYLECGEPADSAYASVIELPPGTSSYLQKLVKARGYTQSQVNDYLRKLRAWADSVGRTDEYAKRRDGTPRRDKRYYYPAQLVKDYEAAVPPQKREPHAA